ncbi:hypothetical protein EIP91_004395 [Steccherinum ochraceum]|uniref:Uncharacterized protein n=1 Tax=Steccherinum ochraceum TaxID=92696 RepID=A0A4R0S1W1_9APHY|nr:hypothetical protein EIP91_004395 [Steccherinum ochraceum]
MANQTADAATQIQPQMHVHTATYANSGQFSLGDGHISISAFPSVLQPTQFHANGVGPPPGTPSTPATIAGTKRKPDDEQIHSPQKKRGKEVADVEVSESPSGDARQTGARHWTDEEKGKLFDWLVGEDRNWEGFSTQMNTVFREAAAQLFENKKTFTAVKSCYHRNVEAFRQIYALEKYLIQVTTLPPPGSAPPHGFTPLPLGFPNPSARSAFIERRLESARALPVDIGVGNVSPKVVEHWCRKGWYVLFKRRFKEDTEGQIVPYFGRDPSASLLGKGLSPAIAILFPHPDLPGAADIATEQDNGTDEVAADEMATGRKGTSDSVTSTQDLRRSVDDHTDERETPSSTPLQSPMIGIDDSSTKKAPTHHTSRFRIRRPPPEDPPAPSASTSSSSPQQSPQSQSQQHQHSPHYHQPSGVPMYASGPVAAYPGYPPPPHAYPPAHMYPPPPPTHFDYSQAYTPGYAMQHNPQMQHMIQLTQNLVGACTTLVEQLRAQAEDGKALLEAMKKREEQEKTGSASTAGTDRAAFAAQVLGDPKVDEEVKQAAREYLKKLFS